MRPRDVDVLRAPAGHVVRVVDGRTVRGVRAWRARCGVHGCAVRGAWRARLSDALADLHAHEDDATAPARAA